MPHSLPVFSVGTIEEAENLQVLLCRLNYDGRYLMNNFAELANVDPMESLEWAANQMRLYMKS